MNLTKEKAIELLEISEKAHHETIEENRRLRKQIDEARKVIKLYATSRVGTPQPDGTYALYYLGNYPGTNRVCGYQTVHYDPRPAKNYLKKWGNK